MCCGDDITTNVVYKQYFVVPMNDVTYILNRWHVKSLIDIFTIFLTMDII